MGQSLVTTQDVCLRGENAAHLTSAPICALISVFFAARWKRGEPYTPSRSSIAIAGIPRFAHAAIRSSGIEAPSRKLKAEREWNSTYISLSCSLCKRLCHPERSEGSASCGELQIPRFARDDKL